MADQTIITLRNPNAVLTFVDDNLSQEYQKELWESKKKKEENAKLKVLSQSLRTRVLLDVVMSD